MAYRIEIGVDADEGLFLEFAIRNAYTKNYMDGGGIDHRLNIYGWGDDYGLFGRYGQTIASTSNGMITSPQSGLLDIVVPPANLRMCAPFGDSIWYDSCSCRRVMKAKLLAVALDFASTFDSSQFLNRPDIAPATILATVNISFGRTTMPRIILDARPFYPNAPSAGTDCQVAQMKTALAALGLYDQVEQSLTGGETAPETIAWNSGGTMSVGGALSNKIALVTGRDMAGLVAAAVQFTV